MPRDMTSGSYATIITMSEKRKTTKHRKPKKGQSLAEKNPELASEWHPTKNGNLTPEDVTVSSNKKVMWYLPYDDPETGKHFDFEWPARISDRTNGKGCPFISGKAVWRGYNDLATCNPELAAEWHPIKNGNLTPEDVTVSSNKKVMWYLPYDDPETGKHFDFEWPASINNRSNNAGCPFISGKAVWRGYNDLATCNPELAAEWHPTKNGNLTPEDVTVSSGKKVMWLLPYDDPETGKHFDFEWPASINSRTKGIGCPFISGQAVWCGYNDLATCNPELAAEWHPIKNGSLTPRDVTCGSVKKVWWLLPYDDPETGKHFDFEWPASISDRTKGIGCPFISGQAVWCGYNDLATCNPELAAEWHPTKNGNLTPEDVTVSSNKKVMWYLPYDDPKTGKHFDFEWPASINSRTEGAGCPFISGQAVWRGYNDLATCNPELAAEWHPIKNRIKKPYMYTAQSSEKKWWLCKTCGNEWRTKICDRSNGRGCPKCGKW